MEGGDCMPLLIILGILAIYAIIGIKDAMEPECPEIKDWDAYWKATRGKSPKEIRRIRRNWKD